MSFDFAVLEFLQGIRTAAIGDAAVLVSALCNKIVIVALFCLIFWCGNKKCLRSCDVVCAFGVGGAGAENSFCG